MKQLVALKSPIPWLASFQRGRQIHPHLNDLERATRLEETLWGNFSVLDAAAGRHPLDATRTGDEGLACGIAVGHFAVKHKRQRLKPFVRMGPKRKTSVVGRYTCGP